MDYYLLVLVIISVLVVVFVWLVTKNYHGVHDSQMLNLDGDDDRLLKPHFDQQVPIGKSSSADDYEIAAKYLARVYTLNIKPTQIVLGTNIRDDYYKLTGRDISSIYRVGRDTVFDLRSSLGISGEIAIIHDKRLIKRLDTGLDMSRVNDIIEANFDIAAKEILDKTLAARADILKTLLPDVIIDNSYAYLRQYDNLVNYRNVVGKLTEYGVRWNLLMSIPEFDALVYRIQNQVQRNKIK